jgi:ubiquinone/menaquinone biosynthesis C-methylase UbiE
MATFLQRFYYRLRDKASKPGEKGMRHGGYWQGKVRDRALEMSCCATGRLLELAEFLDKNHQVEAWGLDSGKETTLLATQEALMKKYPGRVHFISAQAEELPFEDDFFDIVVAVNLFICLEGIRKVREILRQARRVLKPGGRLIIEFRNKANFFLRLKYVFAKYYDGTLEGHPLSTYHIDEIKAALIQAGFDIETEFFMESFFKKTAPIVMMEAKKRA